MDNQMNTNPINPDTSVPSKEIKKDTLNKKNFFSTPGGIVTVIVIIFLLLVGVAVVSYNLALNNNSKQSNNNVTPTPTPTSTNTPTPSITTTMVPVVTTQAPNVAGKFSVEVDDKAGTNGEPRLEYNIKLNGTLVKNIKPDVQGCSNNIPKPVTNADQTRVYYVDTVNLAVVKSLNTSKTETTAYTAAAPYKMVTAIAVSPKGKLAYTIAENVVVDCNANYLKPKAAFVIDGKVIPQPSGEGFDNAIYQEVEVYGDNYFVTTWELNGVGVGGGAQSVFLRKSSDASLVKSFSSAGVIYSGSNYAIVTDGYGDVPETGPEGAKDQNVFKIDLVSGAVTYIVSDTLVSNFEIKNNKLIITYGGYLNDNYELVGTTKTLEYNL